MRYFFFFILHSSFFTLHSSLFIIHSSFFISKVTCSFFFCPSKRKRTKKENSPSAFSPLRMALVLLAWTSAAFGIAQASLALLSFARCLSKARKLASCACSNSPRFLTENAPHSLNAPKMRSELTDFLLFFSYFVTYGFLQHRFARLGVC